MRPNEQVLAVEPCGTGVAVVTDKGRIEAGRVVLANGAWLPGLVGGTVQRVAEVHRQVLLWFEADEPALYDPARCPVFIWMHGNRQEDYVYGFPLLPGCAGVKAATETYPGHVEPDAVERDVPEWESRGVFDRHVRGKLRGVSDRLVKSATCLYTVTPDAGFIVDRLNGSVVAASACSGHGFKHSPALGEELAALALEDGRALEPSWGLARFG